MTDNTVANIWGDIIRTIYRLLDSVVYWILGLMYQIFFNVASAELFTNETVKNFYGRVQLILGVFMIFKLAVSIVKGIVNPDSFTDKNNGMGNIIYRIIFSLVMLTIIAPINIPNAQNEYEIQLNNNGLLFGTLYSLQNRILSNNTLGRLILGTTDGNTTTSDGTVSGSNKQNQKLEESADMFTSTILKGFIRINLKEGKEDETQSENWMCPELDEDTKSVYTDLNADPEQVIALTTLKCDAEDASLFAKIIGSDQRYMFAYKGLISAIVGGVFVWILLNFTVDIAVRAIKLAILRLLAPIPIIAYIDPNGEKQTFNSWTKLLTSTYLDLFIRLAIIYFVIFLIQDIITNGLVINKATGVVGILTYIFIFLGLFIFAKQAPKFIKQIFGMKDDGGKMFGGFGEALGIGAAGLGMVGSGIAGYKAAKEENDALNPNQNLLNGFRNVGSGFANALAGGYAGLKGVAGAKDHHTQAAIKAVQQQNALRSAHSTMPGRLADNLYGLANGKSLAARDQAVLDANKKAASSIKKFKGTAVDEAMKKGTYGTVSTAHDRTGLLSGIQFNYRNLEAAMKAKDDTGQFTYTDAAGTSHSLNVSMFDSNTMADIEDTQTARYLAADYDVATGKFNNNKIQTDWSYAQHDLGDAEISYTGNYLGETSYGDIGKAIGTANTNASTMENDMRHIMNRANNQANKK